MPLAANAAASPLPRIFAPASAAVHSYSTPFPTTWVQTYGSGYIGPTAKTLEAAALLSVQSGAVSPYRPLPSPWYRGRSRRPRAPGEGAANMGIGTTLIVATAIAVPGDVVEFERAAGYWLAAVENAEMPAEIRAFDEFVPGIGGVSCLVDPPGQSVIMELDNGLVTASAFDDEGLPICPVFNGSPGDNHSDGRLDSRWQEPADGKFVLEFEPGIRSFYTYYGSFQAGIVTMHLYSDEVLVATLDGPEPPGPPCDVCAVGHGFVSGVLVDRIEFTINIAELVTVGVFPELANNEDGLGEVMIPEYGGVFVPLDFGVAYPDPCPADLIDDGIVDFRDILFLLSLWGPCEDGCFGADIDGDGVVGFSDLLIVLREWGPCS